MFAKYHTPQRPLRFIPIAFAAAIVLLLQWAQSPLPAQPVADPSPVRLPLGLEDVSRLLEQTENALDDYSTTPTLRNAQALLAPLGAAKSYCEKIAEAEVGRIPYRWFTIGSKRVSQDGVDVDRYRHQVVIFGAMAMRFQAQRVNIFVLSADLMEANGQATQIPIMRHIRADLPRRPVIYFSEPRNLQSVFLSMRQQGHGTSRLALQIGVPERPEYAREIAGLCQKAETMLRLGDIEESRRMLQKAQDRIADYKRFLGRAQ